MKSPQAKSVRLLQEKYQENLEMMFKNLLKDESLSDVAIHCRDGVIRAHRVILAACSPYFKKIFQEHPEPQVVFLVHGVPAKQMKSLIELMYRGSADVSSDLTTRLFEIADDFGVKGIIDENDKSFLNNSGRDTRFKGQKRVAVDFEKEAIESDVKNHTLKVVKQSSERRISVSSEKSFRKSTENLLTSPSSSNTSNSSNQNSDNLTLSFQQIKQEPQSPSISGGSLAGQLSAEARRRNNWAMKQRKYKCVLCPASFKRASHLTRHQLVHTGERPYTCSQCEKAFSRHDKLKHHIRKAHEMPQYDDLMNSNDNSLYTIRHVEVLSPHTDFSELPTRITREDLMPRMSLPAKLPEPVVKVPAATPSPKPVLPTPVLSAPVGGSVTQKKGRGRPRKYPPAPRPLIKRPRGRPRLNPTGAVPQPGNQFECSTPQNSEKNTENYDITNMPFGDLVYLTKSLGMSSRESPEHFEDSNSTMEPNLMEPLVEIQLDQNDHNEREEPEPTVHHTAGSFLQNIGLLENTAVANIGECTISLSSSQGS